ncbi:MAG TPA: hypothetical protein VFA20_10340 [Myxococcaceae bacterium]|nr:hypothetical protein [Myxococcaceae bacterium]
MSAAVLVLHLLATAQAPGAHVTSRPPTALDQLQIDPDAPTWYGWQPLLADATAASLLGGSVVLDGVPNMGFASASLVVAGLGLYLFGGPAMHLLRERPRLALIDLGLRVSLPLAGLLSGLVLTLLTGQPILLTAGLVVGLGSAILFDIVNLSWDPPAGDPAPAAASTTVRWTPFIGATPRGSPLAGVAARF